MTETVPAEGTMFQSPTFKILDFLFGIPIIHDIMFGVYRKQIVEKSGNYNSCLRLHCTPWYFRLSHVVEFYYYWGNEYWRRFLIS